VIDTLHGLAVSDGLAKKCWVRRSADYVVQRKPLDWICTMIVARQENVVRRGRAKPV